MSETSTVDESTSSTKREFNSDTWVYGLFTVIAALAIIYVIAEAAIDTKRKDALEAKYDAKISRISESTPHEVVVGKVEMKCLLDDADDTVLLCRPLDGDTFVEPPVAG
jgi:hypothetical protein